MKKHILIIDPSVQNPELESINMISQMASNPISIQLPALFGHKNLLQSTKGASGIIIMGSASSVHDNSDWQTALIEATVNSFEIGIPILGICYGHQLLAHIFGGKVRCLWDGEKKRGIRTIHLKKNMFGDELKRGEVVYSHGEGVVECPEDFYIIASSKMVEIEGIASKTKPIWGFQPHIEATDAFLINHRIEIENSEFSFNFGYSILNEFLTSCT